MIITLEPGLNEESILKPIEKLIERYKSITLRKCEFQGESQSITEIHLIGNTKEIPREPFLALSGVRSVVRVSVKYRLIGRPQGDNQKAGFEYNGVRFDDNTINIFAGLCAIDTKEHTEEMMKALCANNIETARMGIYKPRTSPYDFQGLGKDSLPWVFELAGKNNIKVIALEVCDARHIDEVISALENAGHPTGVMLQIGTRNAQNFELLKQVGQQRNLPVIYKRGMAITLEESLNACEYIASEGNSNIIFCLRGVKSHLSAPHRNLVDFGHVPVIRRLTRLTTCIDPSHSVGSISKSPDGLMDIFHVVGQGIISGASSVLIEFHPNPMQAICDGHQALTVPQIPKLLEYVKRVRQAYEDVVEIGCT